MFHLSIEIMNNFVKNVKNGTNTIRFVGLDESGVGAWAGPMTVGAVASPLKIPIWWDDIKDSKSISEAKRELFFLKISESKIPWATYEVSPQTIDEIGYSASLKLAFSEVMKKIKREFSLPNDIFVIIDGSQTMDIGNPIVKADKNIKEVSAASVVAKVIRDRYMHTLDSIYPEYGFGQHKGYGTEKHRDAILKHGVSPIHRRSIKPIAEIINGNRMRPPLDNEDNRGSNSTKTS